MATYAPLFTPTHIQEHTHMATQLQFKVTFPACGAEYHPRFKDATRNNDGTYTVAYPIHVKGILKSRKAQMDWTQDVVKHLRTWGKSATITE